MHLLSSVSSGQCMGWAHTVGSLWGFSVCRHINSVSLTEWLCVLPDARTPWLKTSLTPGHPGLLRIELPDLNEQSAAPFSPGIVRHCLVSPFLHQEDGWASVTDGGPTSTQHWVIVLCFLGRVPARTNVGLMLASWTVAENRTGTGSTVIFWKVFVQSTGKHNIDIHHCKLSFILYWDRVALY